MHFTLRVGEMTVSNLDSSSTLQLQQMVQLVDSLGRVQALKFIFHNFKPSYNQRPFSIVIHRKDTFCPVEYFLA